MTAKSSDLRKLGTAEYAPALVEVDESLAIRIYWVENVWRDDDLQHALEQPTDVDCKHVVRDGVHGRDSQEGDK